MSRSKSIMEEVSAKANPAADIVVSDKSGDRARRKREKNQKALFSRRAVEDLLERKKFHNDFNYLLEEDFDSLD